MTPEDKAKIIYDGYYMLFFHHKIDDVLISLLAKKCSIQAVDLLIKHDGSSKYLKNVKECLNKY